jgi:hypothetical protein
VTAIDNKVLIESEESVDSHSGAEEIEKIEVRRYS